MPIHCERCGTDITGLGDPPLCTPCLTKHIKGRLERGEIRQDVLDHINVERAKIGKPPLVSGAA